MRNLGLKVATVPVAAMTLPSVHNTCASGDPSGVALSLHYDNSSISKRNEHDILIYNTPATSLLAGWLRGGFSVGYVHHFKPRAFWLCIRPCKRRWIPS